MRLSEAETNAKEDEAASRRRFESSLEDARSALASSESTSRSEIARLEAVVVAKSSERSTEIEAAAASTRRLESRLEDARSALTLSESTSRAEIARLEAVVLAAESSEQRLTKVEEQASRLGFDIMYTTPRSQFEDWEREMGVDGRFGHVASGSGR